MIEATPDNDHQPSNARSNDHQPSDTHSDDQLSGSQFSGPSHSALETPGFDPVLAERLISEAADVLPESLRTSYPVVAHWIDDLLSRSESMGKPIDTNSMKRLSHFFPEELLSNLKFIPVPECPNIPFEQLGINEISFPTGMQAAGITFRDRYFTTLPGADNESLHFHESVHVVQWTILGDEAFVFVYAAGLLQDGYRNSPLEEMAYDLQARFDAGDTRFDVVKEVRERLENLRIERG